MDQFKNKVGNEEELRSIIGFPSELASKKVISYIDSHCADFIANSPILVLATADEQGFCNVSPRGDLPGFVHVLNEKQFVIPERPGNKRLDSLCNILSNPKIGLLFFIPGMEETLRINGKAAIIKDEELLEKMAVKGKKPLLGIGVEVEECFIHCAKALKRSSLWDTDSWPAKETLPSAAKILFEHAKLPNSTVNTIQKGLEESYTKRLY